MSSNSRRDRALIGLLSVGIAANLWALSTAKGRAYTQPVPSPLPIELKGWKGTPQPPDPGAQAILPHAGISTMIYEQPPATPLEAVIVASRDPNDMHTPERCLVGGGFELASDETRPLHLDGSDGGTWTLHRLLFHKQGQEWLLFYGYEGIQGGGGSTFLTRVAMKLGGPRKAPAYLFRVSSPTFGQTKETEERLLAFTADLLRVRRTWKTGT